jgi:hypothetical protein
MPRTRAPSPNDRVWGASDTFALRDQGAFAGYYVISLDTRPVISLDTRPDFANPLGTVAHAGTTRLIV